MRQLTLGLTLAALAALAVIGSALAFRGHRAPAPPAAPAAVRPRATAPGPAPGPAPGSTLSSPGAVPILGDCVVVPHDCGFPDATNTGVPPGTVLKSVPGQVSGGPGWSYSSVNHAVNVTGAGAVLSGLSISCDLNIAASHVTIKNDSVVTGGTFGISLRHTAGVTIENSTIRGLDKTTGRVGSAIDDVYGNSTGIAIRANNISDFSHAVQVSTGTISGNYIHDPGYIAGDHTDGIYANGTDAPLMIDHNTILDRLGQTGAINLDGSRPGVPVANKTIENNLIGGGSYAIYGGNARHDPVSRIVIKDNRFSRVYYPSSGQYGPVAYFSIRGAGNAWSGNTWDATDEAIPAP